MISWRVFKNMSSKLLIKRPQLRVDATFLVRFGWQSLEFHGVGQQELNTFLKRFKDYLKKMKKSRRKSTHLIRITLMTMRKKRNKWWRNQSRQNHSRNPHKRNKSPHQRRRKRRRNKWLRSSPIKWYHRSSSRTPKMIRKKYWNEILFDRSS